MDYARAKASGHSVQASVVDAPAILLELRQLFDPIANKNKNALVLRHDGLHTFCSDAEKFKTIIINLLSNACKYTSSGSISVHICVSVLNVTLVVDDSGCGIDSHALDTVWDEFRQCEMGENRAMGGTGLGLAVTKAFVQLLGGSAALQSSKGQGTRVTVVIPTLTAPRAITCHKDTTDANV